MANTSDNETILETMTNKRHIGQVKWFNSKAGYGFITVKAEDETNMDIFTHYSVVKVVDAQYKYLVQGEYVEFELTKSSNEKHKYQATDITGIQNGKLMCETRQQFKSQQRTQKTEKKERKQQEDGFTKVVSKKMKKESNAAVAESA